MWDVWLKLFCVKGFAYKLGLSTRKLELIICKQQRCTLACTSMSLSLRESIMAKLITNNISMSKMEVCVAEQAEFSLTWSDIQIYL